MTRTNSKLELESEPFSVEHELPAVEDSGNTEGENAQQAGTDANTPASRTETEKLKAERDALLDRLTRMQAEFENSRKRSAREQREHKDFALAGALKSLLPILDSFDRALQAPTENVEEFRSGVVLIRKQLHDAMSKLGLKPIPAKGQPFDPHVHEAIEMVESSGGEENHVLEELQPGYKLGHRLLRPAMVRVAHDPKKK